MYSVEEKIGKLTILYFSTTVSQRPTLTAICKCECGNKIELPISRLKKTRSCGCSWHHKSNTKIYWAWVNMRSRCLDISDKEYENYGGRGIKVCEGLMSFNNFLKILGEPPTKYHSNDRIDNSNNYSCGECDECKNNSWIKNVRWATNIEQARNRRNNILVEFNGKQICLSEFIKINNMKYSTISMRINKYGWSLEEAIKIK